MHLTMRGLVGSILVAATVVTLPGASQGTARSCGDQLTSTAADLPVPSLMPPPGATAAAAGQGAGSSAADFRCRRRFDTALDTAALATHFEAQMTEKGWRIANRNREDAAMAVTLFAGSVPATPLTGMLVVTALQGTASVDVVLRIVRHSAPGDERLPDAGAGRAAGRTGGGGGGVGAAVPPSAALQGLLNSSPLGSPGEAVEMRGSLPADFPADVLPAGAEVKQVAVSPTRTTVVALATGLTPYKIPSVLAALHGKGWLGRRPGGGFAADESGQFARPIEYCRGQDTATVSYHVLGGAIAIRASHARQPGRSCLDTPAQTGSFADVPMPLLVPPAPMGSGSGGGGVDVFDGATRVQSAMAASAISKDFATQLALGGWKVVQQAHTGERSTMVRAHNTTGAGDPVTALVVTTSLSGTPRVDLWLHVVRHKPVTPGRGGN